MMGMAVGVASGTLFGGFSGLRYVLFSNDFTMMLKTKHFRAGLRGFELVKTVGKASVQAGGTFGTFMAIGSGIRC